MKLSASVTVAALVAIVQAAEFAEVVLTPPLNWLAGGFLFPSQVIASYNSQVDKYSASAWEKHVLDACKSYAACTSATAFQG